MYVDDLLKSLDTIEDVRTLQRENKQLFANSGFELTKWSTNAPEVYLDILEAETGLPDTDALDVLHTTCQPLETTGTLCMVTTLGSTLMDHFIT